MSDTDRIAVDCGAGVGLAFGQPEVRSAIDHGTAYPAVERAARHHERATPSGRICTASESKRIMRRARMHREERLHRTELEARVRFMLASGVHSMDFHTLYLQSGNAMARAIADDGSLTVIYGEGGGCTFNACGGVQAILVPLCGSLHTVNWSFANTVQAGEALVTEYARRLKIVGHIRAQWLALLGGKQTWAWMLGGREMSIGQLLPASHLASSELRRHAIALARTRQARSLECGVVAVTDDIMTLQKPLYEAVLRCPGRTKARRLDAFARLQRVRNFIDTCCDQDINSNALARMADYSRSYFIRAFTVVFQQTPHAYLVEQRLQKADRFLNSGYFAVGEAGLASGFENRCVFSRLFRRRFGTTANETRRKAEIAACAG